MQIVKTFDHAQSEVTKARSAMGQDWKIIASLLNNGEIAVYNYDEPEGKSHLTLRGLEDEGFGMCWNLQQRGILAGATGQKLCIWDTNSTSGEAKTNISDAHPRIINDAKFSNL